ncbi:MAG: DUF481 domain-containing protein [Candidatus Aminicenantaceae bacterium]
MRFLTINSAKLLLFFSFFLLTVLAPVETYSDNGENKSEASEKKLKYSSTTSLSLLLTQGNNDSFNFGFKTEQNLQFDKNNLNLNGNIIFSTSEGERKNEIYYSHLKFNREISKRLNLLSLLRMESNKFAGYNFRLALAAGAGYSWIKSKNLELLSEITLGWSNENNIESMTKNSINHLNSPSKDSVSESFMSSVISTKITYSLSDSAKIAHHDIIFLKMKELKKFRINSFTSISASINKHFALEASLQINYDPYPVEGFKKLDLFILSSLVINI